MSRWTGLVRSVLLEEARPNITLVGTAHISPESVALVESTIRARRPSKVLIELDERRAQALLDPETWANTDIFQVIKQKKQHLFMIQVYLSAMQSRMGRETGVSPGAEMLRAIQVAKEVGAEVVLMDRDVGVTLRRGFDAMGFWQKVGLGLNFTLEMLPVAPPPANQSAVSVSKRAATALASVAAALAILLVSSLREKVANAAGFILDRLVGFPRLPLLTVLLTTFLLALFIMPAVLRRRGSLEMARALGAAAPGVLAGAVLLAWFTQFTRAPANQLLTAWPAAYLPAEWGVLGAVALAAMGGATAGVILHGAGRHFWERRALVSAWRGELDIEAMLKSDAITQMTEEFARFAPGIKVALIDERDAFMASHIHEQALLAQDSTAARATSTNPLLAPSTAPEVSADGTPTNPPPGLLGGITGGVVAVIGAGHLPGIRRYLAQPDTIPDRAPLARLPPKRLTIGRVVGTLVGWGLPASFVLFFAYLAYTGRFQDLIREAGMFILITGSLSALGCALAWGHPLSILTAFVAAPFGVLHPLLATGWFSGLVEAKVRTPKVADFQALKNIETLGQFWRNGVARVLLVTALTNVGAMISVAVVGTRILRLVGVG